MKPDSRKRERGSAMVETAITIPLLLVLMVGIFASAARMRRAGADERRARRRVRR
jgi:Flp pilus assembly protein TadG